MKKFFKKAWFEVSCLVIIAIGIVMAGSAWNCSHAQSNIPDIELGINCEAEIHYIGLYGDGVVDFNYTPEGEFGEYTIEYVDDDAFDYDNLSFEDEDWYGDFILLECTEEVFLDYMKHYNKIKGTDDFYDFDKKYQIMEVIDDGNYSFYLVKK